MFLLSWDSGDAADQSDWLHLIDYLKSSFSVYHVHGTAPAVLFSVEQYIHKDPRHTAHSTTSLSCIAKLGSH